MSLRSLLVVLLSFRWLIHRRCRHHSFGGSLREFGIPRWWNFFETAEVALPRKTCGRLSCSDYAAGSSWGYSMAILADEFGQPHFSDKHGFVQLEKAEALKVQPCHRNVFGFLSDLRHCMDALAYCHCRWRPRQRENSVGTNANVAWGSLPSDRFCFLFGSPAISHHCRSESAEHLTQDFMESL